MTYFSTAPPSPGMPLDPALQAVLQSLAGATPIETLSPVEARRAVEQRIAKLPKRGDPVAKIEEHVIRGPGGPLRVRVYSPAGSGPFAIVLFVHGGGWMLGSLDIYDDLSRSLCHRSGCLVASVDYRLTPETRFPGPLEDCFAALQWCAREGGNMGGDPTRLLIAGDSAGGHLAASLAIYSRDKHGLPLKFQALIYPVTNHGFDTASYHENAEGFGLTRAVMMHYWNNFKSSAQDVESPYFAPLRAPNLAGLPPALIVTAQYDPLRDDGEAYAARLHRAGVPVRCIRYLDMNHSFLHYGGTTRQAKHALDEVAGALKQAGR